jgi:hypothetical protein
MVDAQGFEPYLRGFQSRVLPGTPDVHWYKVGAETRFELAISSVMSAAGTARLPYPAIKLNFVHIARRYSH